MFKRFFVSLLGTIAGIWISVISVVIIGSVCVGIMLSGDKKTAAVEKNSVLYIDLTGDIIEREANADFMTMLSRVEQKPQTLEDIVKSIQLSANDKKIEGIYIKCGGSSLGVASREEMMQALRRFKESGKWIYAYGDAISQGDYHLASVADEIYLNPVGNVNIRGIGSLTPFFTGLLDKLGVKVQVVKVGTYKSAVEPFILKEMSEAARLQNKVYIDSIWSYYAATIADNRSIAPARVSAWADSLTYAWTAEECITAGVITKSAYAREFDKILKAKSGIKEDDDIRLVSPSEYIAYNSSEFGDASDKHIAVYYAVGDIVDSGSEGIVGKTVVKDIVDLADDDNVEGLVLRVNSPGGSAFASEQIWEALQYFKSKDKPFYVSMGDYAASGGYYISCGADSIYADKTTLTGSIGVFGMIPDFSGLVTGKLGVTFSEVASSPNAAFMSLVEPMTPYQLGAMQKSVNEIYELFTSRVAEGRGMAVDSVKAIAEGRVWVGSSAVSLGLVDRIGSLTDCINDMADNLSLRHDQYVSYPSVDSDIFKALMNETGRLDVAGMAFDKETLKALHAVKRLREAAPVQARMPEIEIR